ncbi:hypothetical protein cce_2763 [Crocosphaera subtropica ATCC 51142]|uniref:Uncharacterized protein n=1 Tax=Crocosphaera subtropica (strain ATCC 51142 / BH68) TaxID=43989 RepID=B1WU49_CROS5|nr:hypothetical protein [Crocosphaera subtropica]ACB52111.1 hypothetical protein cce_2763 [Crocosphaera subtropica ATCC 51142]
MDVRQAKESRNLVLDYALGASLLGLIPITSLLSLKFLVTIILIIKMCWDIGRKWKFARGQDILAIIGYCFGWLGAFAMAFMAWLTLLGIGLFIPYISSFKLASALFTLTWMVGQSTNQYYASGHGKSKKRKSGHEV